MRRSSRIEIHCRYVFIYPILWISVSETDGRWGFIVKKKNKEKTKVRETFLFELLYRRDSFYYIADPYDKHFDAVLDCMGSI